MPENLEGCVTRLLRQANAVGGTLAVRGFGQHVGANGPLRGLGWYQAFAANVPSAVCSRVVLSPVTGIYIIATDSLPWSANMLRTILCTAMFGVLPIGGKILVKASRMPRHAAASSFLRPPAMSRPRISQTDGPSLSGKQFVGDDYHAYHRTSDLRANISTDVGGTASPGSALYDDGPNAGLAELDSLVTYNGHPTVKYNQLRGTIRGPELWVGFPRGTTTTNIWFRAIIRFSPGFTTFGITPNSANAYKLLGWGWVGANGRGGLGFTNTTDYTLTWNVKNHDGINLGFAEPTGFRKITSEWTDGAWYDYVIHYEQVSTTTTRTSFYLGRNDDPPKLVYVMVGTINKGQAIPAVNRVMLGLNFNSVRVRDQALWYGQWEVVDGSQHRDPFNLAGAGDLSPGRSR